MAEPTALSLLDKLKKAGEAAAQVRAAARQVSQEIAEARLTPPTPPQES